VTHLAVADYFLSEFLAIITKTFQSFVSLQSVLEVSELKHYVSLNLQGIKCKEEVVKASPEFPTCNFLALLPSLKSIELLRVYLSL
jgi:hypothetical protein